MRTDISERCDDLQHQCELLQAELRASVGLHSPNKQRLNGTLTPASQGTHLQPKATRRSAIRQEIHCDPPHVMKLEDTSKRSNHESRLEYQERYCSTLVKRLQDEAERMQKACDDAHVRAKRAYQREMRVREELRLARAQHREVFDVMAQHLKLKQDQLFQKWKARTVTSHEKNMAALRQENEDLKRKAEDDEAQYKRETKRMCDKFARDRLGSRYEQKDRLEQEAEEWRQKIEWAQSQWDGEREALIHAYAERLRFQEEQSRVMGSDRPIGGGTGNILYLQDSTPLINKASFS